MRYYDLQILPLTNGVATPGAAPVRHWTSHPNGPTNPPDPGALRIDFDANVSLFAQPIGGVGGADYAVQLVRVWGVPISDVSQAANLSAPDGSQATYGLILRGGMGKGLPLCNPAEIGVLMQGVVWRAIGNWIGTSMYVDFYVSPGFSPTGSTYGNASQYVPPGPINRFTFYCQKGEWFGTAIQQALAQALPGVPVTVSVSSNLVAQHTEIGAYYRLQEFAEFLRDRSRAILGLGPNNSYQGVSIVAYPRTNGILISDGIGTTVTGTYVPKTVTINFYDLIGQPSWIDNNTVTATMILRGDLSFGDTITFPPTITTVSAQGALINPPPTFTQARYSSIFQGSWTVRQLRHVGSYKAPRAESWMTWIEAIANPGPAVGGSAPKLNSGGYYQNTGGAVI